MPVVREVVGIFAADLHFSETPPVFRSVEPDWMEVQWGYVNQLRQLQLRHPAPIFLAGDVFDRWNSSPHLIGQVIHWFSGMDIHAIPGNHDTPQHNHKELVRSAYWCLVEAGVVKHLTVEGHWPIGQLIIHPFPHGFPVKPCPAPGNGLSLDVALVHSYIWINERTGHRDASTNQMLGSYLGDLRGYDVAVFGDNHKGWLWQKTKQAVYNCGSFMRRTTTEKDYKPNVGLLYSDGTIKRHYLDVSADKFLDMTEELTSLEKSLEIDLSEFAEELANLHGERLDYARAVVHWINKNNMPKDVRMIMLRALGVKGR